MFDNLSLPTILVSYVALLFSLSVHEASHATAAYLLEDDTAARLGRMTLNPIAHIDLLGTVVFPLLGMITGFPFIGWAKPVPVDPRKLTRRFTQRVGYAFVASAGPASNVVQAGVFLGALVVLVKTAIPDPSLQISVFEHAIWSFRLESLQVFQLPGTTTLFLFLLGQLVIINIILAFFNLLPMGPLDGAGILRGFLPWRWLPKFDRVQPWMGGILIVAVLTGVFRYVIGPVFLVLQLGTVLLARAVFHI
ncbi:MAG TPA: site-2 protease family protein [Holophagaceae bacterium]